MKFGRSEVSRLLVSGLILALSVAVSGNARAQKSSGPFFLDFSSKFGPHQLMEFENCEGMGLAFPVNYSESAGGVIPIGRVTMNTIVCRRPASDDSRFWEWMEEVSDITSGAYDGVKFPGTLTYDGGRAAVAEWELMGAWPIAVTTSATANSGSVMEQVTISVDGIRKR